MPARTWQWRVASHLDDQAQKLACVIRQPPPRRWNRPGAVWTTAVLSLLPLLALAGHLYAQEPSLDTAPVAVPVVPGPFEALPTPQERLLAPVPQQFNWLGREAPVNPLLETLLSIQTQTPTGLTVSTSLTEEVSDNIRQQMNKGKVDSRTGVALGTIYRLDNGQSFVSLANTVRAFYETTRDRGQFGFANVALNAGYQLPPWSFGLTDSFARDDGTAQGTTTATTPSLDTTQGTSAPFLRTQQGTFMRNTVRPQVQYALSPRTTTTLGYTNTIVVEEDSNQGNSVSHSVTAGIRHQFSPALTGGGQYSFTTSTGSGASGGLSHHLSTDLTYQFDPETSAILSIFGTLVNRSTTGNQSTTDGRDSKSYGASIGGRRVLFAPVSITASIGPLVIKREGESERLRANWQVSLDGPISLFATPELTLTLVTNQNVIDTSGEVTDVGLVLRQLVEARLNYKPTAFLSGVVFARYVRDEILEGGITTGTTQGQKDNFWSAGVSAAYALTRVISLTGIYSYQRRDANGAGNNFDENRVMVAVTGTFPIF